MKDSSHQPGEEEEEDSSTVEAESGFPITQWDLVALARDEGKRADEARERLCRMYWDPLWSFARKKGLRYADAQDAVQDFLAHFLEKGGGFGAADQERGRMRSYLLKCFENHLIGQWQMRGALKRGAPGGTVPYEEADHAPPDGETPERLYLRKWALSIMSLTMERLAEKYRRMHRVEEYKILWPMMGADRADYGAIPVVAQKMEVSEGLVRTRLSRLRERFQQTLMATIGETMGGASEEEVLEEMKVLREAAR